MENHNIGWMMCAIVIEVFMALFCAHFGIGVTAPVNSTSAMPVLNLTSVSWISWLFDAMTFQLHGLGVIFSAITWICDFVVLWCIIPLIIAGIQAIATFVP